MELYIGIILAGAVYCVLSKIFSDRNNRHNSVVTAMRQPSTSKSIFCVFGSFASSLSWHLAYRAVVAIIFFFCPCDRQYLC